MSKWRRVSATDSFTSPQLCFAGMRQLPCFTWNIPGEVPMSLLDTGIGPTDHGAGLVNLSDLPL